MEPSERIAIILEISRRLGAEQWSVIDLTLRQYGLPTRDMWEGGRDDYVMTSIDKADPEILRSLARHLGFEGGSGRPATNPDFWRDDYLRLFISHLATHKKFAGELQATLTQYGISSFVAHNDIEPTREWEDEIEAALGSCDAALALMHPEFHQSYWVDQEIGS